MTQVIKGYTALSPDQVYAINEGKDAKIALDNLLDQIAKDPQTDQATLEQARVHLTTGFMWLTRAIARPTV